MIVLSNAHHKRWPGARNESIGMDEYTYSCEINRKIANLFTMEMPDEGVYILDQSWKTSYNESLREKVKMINSLKPDLAVENHLNAVEDTTVQGCETLHYPDSIKGTKLASLIQEEILGLREIRIDRGLKQSTVLLLRGTTVTTVITEPLFISNQGAILLLDEKFMDKLARAIYTGIVNFLESERNE